MTVIPREPPGAAPGTGEPEPLLFLISDTGGGHRSAARAVGQALDGLYPGRFAPVLCDPLGGPGASRLLRLMTACYGPVTRTVPWLWGAAYYLTDSGPAMTVLTRLLLRRAVRPVTQAALACSPAAIVSFHPLTGFAAVAARAALPAPVQAPVVIVVTDLAGRHAAWRSAPADLIVEPDGPPVTREFRAGAPAPAERAALRAALGLPDGGRVIVLAGGAEGSGGIGRRAVAIARHFPDVTVVAVCGRNRRLERRLRRCSGQLVVVGFTDRLADWLRCADLAVTKAGPSMIAEAACCGVPLLLTSHLPGQEKGNAGIVTGAGAGLHGPSVRAMLAAIGRLLGSQEDFDRLRAGAARLGQPGSAASVAREIAELAESGRDGPGAG